MYFLKILVESSGISLISSLIKMKLVFPCTDMAEYVLFIYIRHIDHFYLIYQMKVAIFMASDPEITATQWGSLPPPPAPAAISH